MSTAVQFYVSTVCVYVAVSLIACWALNLQFGVTGILNFAFIAFQALGAYTASVLTLGSDKENAGFQHFILGAHVPYPISVLAAGAVGGIAAVIVGAIGLRRLRSDYQAMVFLVVSIIATEVAINKTGIVNGSGGLSLVPQPLAGGLGLSSLGYQWFYVALLAVYCIIAFFFVHRLTRAPFGRSLRAIRDNEDAAEALGINVYRMRLTVFGIGGAMAAISGAALVQFIGAWGTGSWMYPETFLYLAAVIIGGSGNNLGVALGALLVPVVFNELPRFVPEFGRAGLVDALRWLMIGTSILVFLYFRPRGILPERRRSYGLGDTEPRARRGLQWPRWR